MNSVARQKKLLKVQKDQSQARLKLHMQRFERLYEVNHATKKNGRSTQKVKRNDNFGTLNLSVDLNKGRLTENIMKHSPRPANYLQQP